MSLSPPLRWLLSTPTRLLPRPDFSQSSKLSAAWVTLATVTLTNGSQLYYDISSIGQPPRLWRVVPVP